MVPALEYKEPLASSGPVNTEQTRAVKIIHTVRLHPQTTSPGLSPDSPSMEGLAAELQEAALPGSSQTC